MSGLSSFQKSAEELVMFFSPSRKRKPVAFYVPVFFPKLLSTPGMSCLFSSVQRNVENGYVLFLCPEAYIKDWNGSLPSFEVSEV
jgi:hypothetical protein